MEMPDPQGGQGHTFMGEHPRGELWSFFWILMFLFYYTARIRLCNIYFQRVVQGRIGLFFRATSRRQHGYETLGKTMVLQSLDFSISQKKMCSENCWSSRKLLIGWFPFIRETKRSQVTSFWCGCILARKDFLRKYEKRKHMSRFCCRARSFRFVSSSKTWFSRNGRTTAHFFLNLYEMTSLWNIRQKLWFCIVLIFHVFGFW